MWRTLSQLTRAAGFHAALLCITICSTKLQVKNRICSSAGFYDPFSPSLTSTPQSLGPQDLPEGLIWHIELFTVVYENKIQTTVTRWAPAE